MKGTNKLVLRNIFSFREEGVTALQNFSFDLKEGEVHALYGEHFCGKSSVVNIIAGSDTCYRGEIFLDGNPVRFLSPRDSLRRNIRVIHQFSSLIPEFNTYENVYSGRFSVNWLRVLNKREMSAKVTALASRFGLDFNMNIPVRKLSSLHRNFVEIAKAFLHDPQVLLLDEVSSRFKQEELKILHTLLREHRERGRSSVYLFSNINEDFDFADRITILKEGRRQGTEDIANVDKSKLIELSYARILTAGQDWGSFLEKRFSESIIDELKEGIIVLDRKMNVSAINRSALEILDLQRRGENLMERLREEFILDANSRDLILSSLTRNFHLSLTSIELINGKYMDIGVFPYSSDREDTGQSIIILEDVTEKCHMQEYKIGADKIFSVAELAAGVVHEINNPLAIISNYTELLKMRNTDENSLEKFGKIEAELLRIEEISSSLLSFSKVQSGKSVIDFRQIVKETLVLLDYKIRKKDIALDLRFEEGETFMLWGNSNKLKQVIINLVVNSIESVLDEGTISIDVGKKEGCVHMTVEDNGSGIDESVQSRIFDPFFSTKVTKKNTGLGLAISKQIVEDHRGEIGCFDLEDKTVFFVSLPESGPEEDMESAVQRVSAPCNV